MKYNRFLPFCVGIVLGVPLVWLTWPILHEAVGRGQDEARTGNVVVSPSAPTSVVLLSELTSGSVSAEANAAIKNVGKKAASLQFVGTSCGCVGITVGGRISRSGDAFSLEPGAQVQVAMLFHIDGEKSTEIRHYAKWRVGEQKEEQEELVVPFRLRALADIEVQPGLLNVEVTDASEAPAIRKVEVTRVWRGSTLSRDITVDAPVFGKHPFIVCSDVQPLDRRPTSDAGFEARSWRLTLKISSPPPAETFDSGTAIVPINFNRDVPGRDVTVGELRVLYHQAATLRYPKSVIVPWPSESREVGVRVAVYATDGRPFRIVRAMVGSDAFAVDIDRTTPNSSQSISITRRRDDATLEISKLEVCTDHPHCPLVSVALLPPPDHSRPEANDGVNATR